MIERILPTWVATADSFKCGPSDTVFPEGDAVLASEEFSAARACARGALEQLAFPAISLLPRWRVAPQWPDGMTGSITCCAGYHAAAVALTRDVVALGVDAEPTEALADEGMLDMIASSEERDHLESLTASMPGICWDRLLFSAKLSVYKAWFPMASWWLNLKLAEIVIDAFAGTFSAELLAPGPLVGKTPITEMRGRWLAHQRFLVTTVVVPAA